MARRSSGGGPTSVPPSPPFSLPRTTLRLPLEEMDFIARDRGPRAVGRALVALVRDWRTLFGLPTPIRQQLEADMRRQGIEAPRDYLVWLLMERHKSLVNGAQLLPKVG